MAELVQQQMEKMVPEIDALYEKGYFSRDELKQVINKRLQFEYAVHSSARKREDFVRYIEYEESLEELRKIRERKKFGTENVKRDVAEHAIIKHVHGIYSRATSKFKGDISLWLQWVNFCRKSRSMQRLSKTLTLALRYNPHVPDLWILAAQREFNEEANPTAARTLMQQGLRLCGQKKVLYVECFKMELTYANRLWLRRKMLGISTDQSTGDEQGGGGAEDSKSTTAMQAVLGGAVASVIYKQAISKFKGDLEFRKEFLSACSQLEFPGAQNLMDVIFESIVADFNKDVEAWNMQARYIYSRSLSSRSLSDSVGSAMDVYHTAVKIVASPAIFDAFYSFLMEILEAVESDSTCGVTSDWVRERMANVCEMAIEREEASEKLLLDFIELLMKNGDLQKASKIISTAVAMHPSSPTLWCHKIDIHALFSTRHLSHSSSGDHQMEDCSTASQTDMQAVHDLIEEAISGCNNAKNVWVHGVQAILALKGDLVGLKSKLVVACLHARTDEAKVELEPALKALLNAVRHTEGVESARIFYKQILQGPAPHPDFMKSIIMMEKCEVLEANEKLLRNLYLQSVDLYNGCVDFWIDYAQFEHDIGKGIGKLYGQVMSAVNREDAQKFVEFCRQLK